MATPGENLKKYRKAAKLSRLSLAMRSKIGVSTIKAIESGFRPNPKKETTAALAHALDIPSYFIDESLEDVSGKPLLKESSNDCLHICEKLNPIDKGTMEMFADLKDEGRAAVREAVIEQHNFQKSGRRLPPPSRHSKAV